MKVALAAAVIALAGAAPHTTVLGWDYDAKRISAYDARTLNGAGAASTTWFRPLCSWSFSPDRQKLALSDCNGTVRFVAVPSLRGLGRLGASSRVLDAASLAWLTPTRMLAVDRANGSVATLLVVDTAAKRVASRRARRRVPRPRGHGRAHGGVACAVQHDRSRAPRRRGRERRPAERHGRHRRRLAFRERARRRPCSARCARRASRSIQAALRTWSTPTCASPPSTSQRCTSPTTGRRARLPKALNGTTRVAAWLGRGKLAVSGVDYATTGAGKDTSVTTTPFGLHLLHTATWRYRTLDPSANGLLADGARVFGSATDHWSAWNTAGRTSTTSRRRATRGSHLRSATPTCAPSAG